MAVTTDLVGHWELCDTSGSVATASVGSNGDIKFGAGSTGDASNMYVGAGNGPGGSLKDCGFDFNDTIGEYIQLGNLQTFTNTTITCWVKSSNTDSVTRIYFDDRAGAGDGMGLSRSLNGYNTILFESGRADGGVLDEPHDGTWHFVAATYDGTTGKIFLDNTEVGSFSSAGLVNNSASNATIGRRSFGVQAGDFGGIMADLRIYENDKDATGLAEIRDLARPTFTGTASFTGTLEVGQTLTASYTVDDTTNLSYQWESATDGSGTGATNIGTDSATYTLTGSEDGDYIRVTVTATSAAGLSASSTSAWNGPVASGATAQTWDVTTQAAAAASAASPDIAGTIGVVTPSAALANASAILPAIDGTIGVFSAGSAVAAASAIAPTVSGTGVALSWDVTTPATADASALLPTIAGLPGAWTVSQAAATATAVAPTVEVASVGLEWSVDTAAAASASAQAPVVWVELGEPLAIDTLTFGQAESFSITQLASTLITLGNQSWTLPTAQATAEASAPDIAGVAAEITITPAVATATAIAPYIDVGLAISVAPAMATATAVAPSIDGVAGEVVVQPADATASAIAADVQGLPGEFIVDPALAVAAASLTGGTVSGSGDTLPDGRVFVVRRRSRVHRVRRPRRIFTVRR